MKAYHVSNEYYAIGETVSIAEHQESNYHKNGTAKIRSTNDYFDKYLDNNFPNYVHRRSALFAFERLEDAKQFCRSEKASFIYEVDFKTSYKGPFVLVNTLMNNLDNSSKCEAIVKEYFTPNLSVDNGEIWYTYELIGSSFKVKRIIQEKAILGFGFYPDFDKSERLFGHNGREGKLA